MKASSLLLALAVACLPVLVHGAEGDFDVDKATPFEISRQAIILRKGGGQAYQDLLAGAAARLVGESRGGGFKLDPWLRLLAEAGKDLREQDKARVADILAKALNTPGAIAKMTGPEFEYAYRAAGALGLEKMQGAWALTWVGEAKHFDRMQPFYARLFARQLKDMGAKGDAGRKKIAALVDSSYMTDVKTLQGQHPLTWMVLADELKGYLDDKQKARWAEALVGAFGTKGDLQQSMVWYLDHAVKALGQSQAHPFLPTWMEANAAWTSWSMGAMAGLADRLKAYDASGKSARRLMIDHLNKTVLADPKQLEGVEIGRWWQLIGALSKEMTERDKALWAKGLETSVAGGGELDAATLQKVGTLMKQLGAKQQGGAELAATWILSGDRWKQADVDDLVQAVRQLSRQQGDAQRARKLVVDYLLKEVLPDPRRAGKARAGAWAGLIGEVEGELDGPSKVRIARQLTDTYADMQAAKFNDAYGLCQALQKLAGRQAKEAFVSRLIEGTTKWTDVDDSNVIWYYMNLVHAGKGADKAQKALAGVVTERLRRGSGLAERMDLSHWVYAAGTLSEFVPEADKALWLTRFTARFGEVGKLGKTEFDNYQRVRRQLGDASPANTAASWLTSSQEWKKVEPVTLAGMVENLKGNTQQTQRARRLVIDHVTAVYVEPKGGARTFGLWAWNKAIPALAPAMTDAEKKAWLSAIERDCVAEDYEAATPLQWVGMLGDKLGDKQLGGRFAAAWAARHDRWRQWSLEDRIRLCTLVGRDKAQAVRTATVEALTAMMKDPAKVRGQKAEQWFYRARLFGEELSQEQKALWVQGLRAAYGDPKTVPAADFQNAAQALAKLGAGIGLVTDWLTGGKGEEALTAGDVYWMMKLTSEAGPAGQQARKLLIRRIQEQFLTDPEQTRKIAWLTWKNILKTFRDDLDKQQSRQWGQALLGAYGMEPRHSLGDFGIFARLGAEGVSDLLLDWLVKTNDWHSWDAYQLVILSTRLSAMGKEAAPARQRLVEVLTSRHFSSVASTRRYGLRHTYGIVWTLKNDVPLDTRRVWLARFRSAFGENKTLTPEELKQYTRMMKLLGGDEAPVSVADWVAKPETWEGMSADDLIAMLSLVRVVPGVGLSAEKLERLETLIVAKDRQTPLGYQSLGEVAYAWMDAGKVDKAQQWAWKAYEKALGSLEARQIANLGTLKNLGILLWETKLADDKKAFPAFAQTLAKLMRSEEITTNPGYIWLARGIKAESGRDAVRGSLLDGQGQVRETVARLLGWAYREAGELDRWQGYLDERISDAGLSGDQRAGWLMARAHAETLETHDPSPLRGKAYLDKALVTAQSETLRLQVLDELVHGYHATGQHDKALAMLQSLGGQFADVESRKRLAAMAEDVKTQKARYEKRQEMLKAEQERRIQDAHREELKRRLEQARKAGDAERVEKLERMLGIR